MEKFTKKKGMFTQTKIAYFVLIIIVGLIFVKFVSDWGERVAEESEIEKCRSSIERNAKLRIGKLNLGAETECNTRHRKIKNWDEERAKQELARQLYLCWRESGRGRLNLFDEPDVYCRICSQIDIEGVTVAGFKDYLLDNKIPGKQISYYEYLAAVEGGTQNPISTVEKEEVKRIPDGEITPGKYYVIFYYAKGRNYIDEIRNHFINERQVYHLGTAVALGTGAGVGTAMAFGFLTTATILGAVPVSVPVMLGVITVSYLTTNAWDFTLSDEDVDWLSFTLLINEEFLKERLTECGSLL